MKGGISQLSLVHFFLLALTLSVLGCRREDIREYTLEIPGLVPAKQALVTTALARFGGIDKSSYRWDFQAKTLTLRYDSMQLAQANIRYAVEEAMK